MKKLIISLLTISTCLSMIVNIKEVKAIDFASKEAYYTKLCSSDRLTSSNKTVCEQFNSYLKQKIKDELKSHGIEHTTIELETKEEHCNDSTCEIDIKNNTVHHHHHH